jgi:hypothetical protein
MSKAARLGDLPSADAAINQIWLQLIVPAQELLAWFAVLTVDGDIAVATPHPARPTVGRR